MIKDFPRTKNSEIKKKTKIYLIDKKYYVTVYLWKNKKGFKTNVKLKNATAAFCSNYYKLIIKKNGEMNISSPRFLGEFHFISGDWSTEVVFHEIQHFIIHRMRVLHPNQNLVIDQEDIEYNAQYIEHIKNRKNTINAEEVVSYEAGRMGDIVYRWLWKNDKNEN